MADTLKFAWKVFSGKRTWYSAQCALAVSVLFVVALGVRDWGLAIFAGFAAAVCVAILWWKVANAKEAGEL